MQDTTQLIFLNKVLINYSKRSEAIEELSRLLSIGKDAVYRRLRGDTELTLEEVKILANRYSLSLDEILFENNEKALFTVNSFFTPVRKFSDYLRSLRYYLDQASLLRNPEVIYATAEIPMFLYGTFPELMCFKMYVWGKTVWNLSTALDNQFSFDLFSTELKQQMIACSKQYMTFKTTELWCLNILDNTLNQLEFVLTNGNFKTPSDSLVVCDKMSALINHVWKMAETGKKYNPGDSSEDASVNFELFHNELVYTNNTILLKSEATNVVFSTFDSPNVLSTTDQRIFEHTENWFLGIKNKSEYITEVSEKSRNQFFNKLEQKINKTKTRLQAYINELA